MPSKNDQGGQRAWWPSAEWAALVQGEGCPLCKVLEEPEADGEGFFVAELASSHLRMPRNQFVRGYCVLVCRVHVKEPHELPPGQQVAFFGELTAAARALESVFQPIKMNYLILGNQVPHLHAHLVPRFADDPAPGAALSPGDGVRPLTDEEYQRQIDSVRAALGRG